MIPPPHVPDVKFMWRNRLVAIMCANIRVIYLSAVTNALEFKITCAKCGQHFCYLCGNKLEASNPYAHFSAKGTACCGKLFEFHHTDDDWQPIEGFDAL